MKSKRVSVIAKGEAENHERPHKREADEEQVRQDRVEEGLSGCEEALRDEQHQDMGGGSEDGAEVAFTQRLRGRQRQVCRGQGALCQDEVYRDGIDGRESYHHMT